MNIIVANNNISERMWARGQGSALQSCSLQHSILRPK